MTPETLGCEVGACEGGGQRGTHGGNVKNEEMGKAEREREKERETDRGTGEGDRN